MQDLCHSNRDFQIWKSRLLWQRSCAQSPFKSHKETESPGGDRPNSSIGLTLLRSVSPTELLAKKKILSILARKSRFSHQGRTHTDFGAVESNKVRKGKEIEPPKHLHKSLSCG